MGSRSNSSSRSSSITSINSGDDTDNNNNRSSCDTDPILEDIIDALDLWTQKILVLETDLQQNSDIKKTIVDCLQRQVLDGLLKDQDAKELQYVLDLWGNLHRAYACRKCGVDFVDEEALTNLLELFSLKQISKSFFIRVALELCRTDSSSGEVV